MKMIYSEFFSWIIDEVSYNEFEIKPIEAITWIIFLILTALTIVSLRYLDNFIDFGVKMIVSGIFAAYFIKFKSIFE